MSTNMKNLKLGHFGGAGFASGSASGSLTTAAPSGKLSSAISNNSSAAVVAASGGSSTNAHAMEPEIFMTSNGVIIPLIRSRDVPKQLPTIAAALLRPADDHLAAEDLDAVQLELELMLSNVALRARVLKAEYDNLDKDEKRNDRRKLDRVPGSPPTTMLNGLLGIGAGSSAGNSALNSPNTLSSNSAKRKRDEPTGVRKKHSSMTIIKQTAAAAASSSSSTSKHAKNSPMAVHTDDSMDYMPNLMSTATALPNLSNNTTTPQLPKMAVPKNDMPNKFWLSVEPYCMPLTNEDLRLIDDLLEQYRGSWVPPVPPLGPHYSTIWAQDDMKALQPGGARIKSQNATAMLKKVEIEESIPGPLTQRLVSALMEEGLLSSEQAAVGEHSNSNSTTTSSNENTHSSSAASAAAGNFRSLSMLKNCVGLEQRLKKELLDNGLLDVSEIAHEEVDEVLQEIKQVTAEMSSLAQFNSGELKRLRAAASEEIKRIELKHKLDSIDQEILECYKRMLQYRAKRKGHTLEEKQEILRLTSEQRALSEQLERMQLNSPGLGGDQKI